MKLIYGTIVVRKKGRAEREDKVYLLLLILYKFYYYIH